MTTSHFPDDSALAEILDLDQDIELLRLGVGSAADPALQILVDLRDDVDRRTAALLGWRDLDDSASLLGDPNDPDDPDDTSLPATTAISPRRWNHRRLAVLPVAGALVLASTGAAAALSSSRQSPLFPLHQLIFGPAPTSDGQITRDLVAANGLLARADAQPYSSRGLQLNQARFLLLSANGLLPQASSSAARSRFAGQIAAATAHIKRLAAQPAPPAPATHRVPPVGVAPSPAAAATAEPAETGFDGGAESLSTPASSSEIETESQAPAPAPAERVTAPATESETAPATDPGWAPGPSAAPERAESEPSGS